MPVVAATVCPHPPLLVPEIAAGAAPELDGLRAACSRAVSVLAGAGPARLVVLGRGPVSTEYADPAGGSFAPFGVPVEVGAGAPAGPLPLSLLVGCWLVGTYFRPRRAVPTTYCAVGADSSDQCAAWGARLDRSAEPIALLVMGDGTARRGPRAPGYHDPRAEPFDRTIAAAFGAVDARAVLELDPTLADELLVAGRAPWQVLAGAVTASGRSWHGELHYAAAPYGVAYFVATWTPEFRAATAGVAMDGTIMNNLP